MRGWNAPLRAPLAISAWTRCARGGRRWRLEELSAETALSVRTLQRRLGGCGFPVSRLTRLIRVQKACRLLSADDLSVTAVAFCAGYSDSAHLSRDFRAVMGMSPSTYRRLQVEVHQRE